MRAIVVAGLLLGAVPAVHAQPEGSPGWSKVPVRPTKHSRDIVVEIPGERSNNNKIFLGALAAVGLIGSGVGLYFHLDSRDTAEQVSANDTLGIPWSPAKQEIFDQNQRSQTIATVGYVIGGGFIVALVATYIATYPKAETTVITTTAMRPIVQPTPGGATLGAAWSF